MKELLKETKANSKYIRDQGYKLKWGNDIGVDSRKPVPKYNNS